MKRSLKKDYFLVLKKLCYKEHPQQINKANNPICAKGPLYRPTNTLQCFASCRYGSIQTHHYEISAAHALPALGEMAEICCL